MVEIRHEDPQWAAVLDDIKSQINRQQFETWFREVHLLSLNEDLARLGVPSVFLRDWIQNYYVEVIQGAITSITGTSPSVEVTVVDAPEQRASATGTPAPANATEPAWTAVPFEPDQDGLRLSSQYPGFRSDVILNPHYMFDGFVVGPSNKLPHAAVLAVAAQPSTAYNPLFLHGSVGLGKTHLLHAVCHALLSRRKDLRILYLSCETFTNQFIAAVKSGNIGNFRYRYRHVDVLVIDDIHFLAKKEQTQEEFFHTFNMLYNSGGQIVLSSDSSPKEIPTLEDRLVSRFKWGLVAEIEPPDFETRMLIVKRKSKLRGADFPDGVCEFVADRITANIRELEGAVLKVLSVADLHERPVDVEIAREALRSLTAPAKRKITVEKIIEIVTRYYDVRQADLQGRRRSKSIAFPRQVCMFLARLLTNHSLEEIGGYFGGRDHTTVIYATEKIDKLKGVDRRFKEELDRLIHELQA
jgi:chromosomal replication initiator protein